MRNARKQNCNSKLKTTMKTQHTPGPWNLEYDYSLVMNHHIVSAGPIGPDEASREEKKANARLIAAAPELLEALKNAYAVIIATSNDIETPLIKEIENVITKAGGKNYV